MSTSVWSLNRHRTWEERVCHFVSPYYSFLVKREWVRTLSHESVGGFGPLSCKIRTVGRSEDLGEGGYNLSPLIGIGLTDLQKCGKSPLPPGSDGPGDRLEGLFFLLCSTWCLEIFNLWSFGQKYTLNQWQLTCLHLKVISCISVFYKVSIFKNYVGKIEETKTTKLPFHMDLNFGVMH